MAIGPVQLIVLGFAEPEFKGEIAAELEIEPNAVHQALHNGHRKLGEKLGG